MQGDIGPGTVPELFRKLIGDAMSGLLFLSTEGREKGVYLDRGHIVHAESNLREEGLAHYLVEYGMVDLTRLETALSQVAPGRTLGDVLCETGLLGGEEVKDARRSLIERIVASVFEWSVGRYMFQDGGSPYSREDSPVATIPLVIEGVRRMYEFEEIRDMLLADERPLKASQLPEHAPDRVNLEPTEGFILSRVDGHSSCKQICDVSTVSEEMTCRVLYGLVTAGVIGPAEQEAAPAAAKPRPSPAATPKASSPAAKPPPSAPRPTPRPAPRTLTPEQLRHVDEVNKLFEQVNQMNHFAVLGIGQDATQDAVEAAFKQANGRFHPRNNEFIDDDALRSKLVYVFGKMAAAHRKLADPVTRKAYDKELRTQGASAFAVRVEVSKSESQRVIDEQSSVAEEHYQKALVHDATRRHHDALEEIKKAIKIYANDARFYALAGKIQSLNPKLRWQKEAENNLKKALDLDSWNVGYALSLAQLYKNAGLRAKAKRSFFRVLELDPNHALAQEEVPEEERPKHAAEPPPDYDSEADDSLTDEPEIETL